MSTNENYSRGLINKSYLLFLLLPPLFSCIISLYFALKTKTKKAIFFFFIFYITCLAYAYPNYDTMLRFWSIHYNEATSFIEGDPLNNLISYFNNYIDSYYFFYIYWIFTIIFFYKLITISPNKLSTIIIIICIFGITLTNLMNLTYFTLSTTFALYFLEKYKLHFTKYLLIICVAYLLHPGILMILIPTIPLHILLKKELYKLSFLYLILLFVILHIIFNATAININHNDNILVSNVTKGFEIYTNTDSVWGGLSRDFGLKGILWKIEQYTLFIITLFFIVKNLNKINTCTSTAFFLTALITLINVHKFYTFTERTSIVLTLSAYSIYTLLYLKNLLSKKINLLISTLIVAQFITSALLFVQPRKHLFKDITSSYNISTRIGYIPTILLITDIHDLGFNDSYLYRNSINRH